MFPNTVSELLGGHRIDEDALGRHCHGGWPTNKALGRSSVIRIQCARCVFSHLAIPLGKELLGRIAGVPTVMMLVVVSGEGLFAPRTGMGEVLEDLGIVGLTLLGFELCFRERVVAHTVPSAGPGGRRFHGARAKSDA
ncbi:MAG: hypothetical protein ACI8PT_000544 [Gammaproteobacteria bacterium]